MPAYGDDNRKKIIFNYYQLFVDRKVGEERKKFLFDLSQWATDIMEPITSVEEKNWDFGGDTVRLQKQTLNEHNQLEMQFMRLSETQMSYVGKRDSDEEEDFELEDNEFPAQDTFAIFDPENSVLMLQRNIQGLSFKGITEYINHFWNKGRDADDKEIIELIPIISKDAFSKAKLAHGFKKITVKTANKYDSKRNIVQKIGNSFSGVLENIIAAAEPVSGLDVEFTISTAPRSKENLLDDRQVNEILNEIEQNPNSVGKASVSYINENNKMEILNLLKATIKDEYIFELPPKSRLRPDVVLYEMQGIYNGNINREARKTSINQAIR
ncbi:DUF6731 family protein [Lactococcus insecticola]|uniref:Uncharacterized protein n=1 Tax=Pseudolactococcus insecticola TaxID=2709158 RepID=A0A6A0B674_9LACT|nr:DUF6731 family protein [Lactococcus insecticola]GFH40215.1 hypothetical protein Hs20B_06130 [Lactococcus insecticola]